MEGHGRLRSRPGLSDAAMRFSPGWSLTPRESASCSWRCPTGSMPVVSRPRRLPEIRRLPHRRSVLWRLRFQVSTEPVKTTSGSPGTRTSRRTTLTGWVCPADPKEEVCSSGEGVESGVPVDLTRQKASASAQSARETRVAPVGVVVRVPITRLRHDECELAHAIELRGDRDGCLRAAYDSARGEHPPVAPH